MYELEVSDIKKILMHYDTIKEQTKNQIIDLYNDLFDTDTLIQVIATKTAHMDGMPKPPGSSKKDLSDIVLRHEKQLKKWYREISYEIDLLLAKEEMLRRVWLCYRILPENEYQVITKVYINKQMCKQAKLESGQPKTTFFRTINRGLSDIKRMYDSDLSNDFLLKQFLSKQKKKKTAPKKKELYEQLSFGLDNDNANCGDKTP